MASKPSKQKWQWPWIKTFFSELEIAFDWHTDPNLIIWYMHHTHGHGTYIRWLMRTCCACMKIGLFGEEEKIRFVTVLDQIKCITQIIKQKLPHMCAPISELPFKTIEQEYIKFTCNIYSSFKLTGFAILLQTWTKSPSNPSIIYIILRKGSHWTNQRKVYSPI